MSVNRSQWVLVDTCIWSSFFTKPESRKKHNVDALLDEDRVAIVGPVLAEVLLGFRRKDQADWVGSRLRLAHYVELQWNDWRSAAELGRELAANGQTIPLTDLVIAAVARHPETFVYTTDPDFDFVPGLKRFG